MGVRVPRDVTGRPTALRDLDLEPFFRPRTVAVIGASETEHRPNTLMWRKLRTKVEMHGATVYPVNPGKDAIDGVKAYASVGDIPGDEPLDLTVVLVGDALAVMPEVIARGSRYAVVFAADFAETGAEGEERQRQLAELVRSSDTRLLGPNTNMNAFEQFTAGLPGRAITLITQSGHQGRPIFQGQEIGIRVDAWAPVGNEVDLEFADFARWFADQPETGAIATYVEGFADGRTLQLALDHCAQRKVPVVAVKVGRTAEGTSMAKAHTGHLTGADAVVDAVFRQYGVTRVDGLDELLDVSAAFCRTPAPTTDGVVIYSISGGTGAHVADLAASAGLNLPTLSAQTQAALRENIPGYLRVSNPVDSGGAPSGDQRGKPILDAILSDPACGVLVCPITGAGSMANRLAKDLVVKAEEHGKPVFVVWGSPVGTEVAYTEILLPSPLPVFRSTRNCLTAVKAYLDHHGFAQRYTSPIPLLPTAKLVELDPLPRRTTLSEHASKQVLAAYGIPVSRDVLCQSRADAVQAAAALDTPAVLKVCSADIGHKSDLGLVRLGLASAAEVEAAYDEVLAAVPAGASVEGVLVCPMETGGVEVVVGVAQDPLFGPVVLLGLGGVFVEVLGDVTHRVPPFDEAEVRRMVGELRGVKMLHGVRGRPAADIDALVDVVMKVQRLALDLDGELAELDINPLLLRPDGAVALDALVVTK
ncbi:MAG TPA: acetate--CoA ligase family protein [Mycobacteriales bacterium]|nr:acetate--CoA ligase family protein [Mycobacteriales bacterium]